MFVECFTNNGGPYLRLVQSTRVTNKDGLKVSKKKAILNIGPLSRFDDGKPDYVERLKKSFKAGSPLIPELLPYCDNKPPLEKYSFSFQEGSPDCFGEPKKCSVLLLERIFEELGINAFFSSYKAFTKLQFDVYGFAKLLIFGRLLNPASKIATVKQNDDYYEKILSDFNSDNVYDTLDFIAQNRDKLIRRINTNLVKKARRSTDIIYYDVTNFYYEIEDPDEDICDEEGNVIVKGFRKMGVCKEERKRPIVQMGLFMDNDGIPIAIESFPGNTLDHLTLRPALKSSVDDMEFNRFILVGDRGICQYRNLLYVLDAGNGYIVSKSLLKSTNPEKNWAYEDDGYIVVSEDFKYKSRIVKRKLKDEDGNVRTINEKVVVYWSKRFQKRAEAENKRFLDFLDKLIASPENFRVTSAQSKSVKRFLRKECLNKNTGEILKSSDLRAMIDIDAVNDYKKSLGYYQIISSELNMDAQEIIEKYHGLTQIEDQFRVMKSDLETRPLFVRDPEHIKAHLLICTIALILIRIIQKRIKDANPGNKNDDLNWSFGMSAERIQNALNKWQVEMMPGDLYRFLNINDPDLQAIFKAFNINIPPKFYRRAELKAIKTAIQVFM
ncbi:MAG: IS1634 family transposase [Clostridia bacterium]|nr:IS1634 family transposase [Clostridia bacterium]